MFNLILHNVPGEEMKTLWGGSTKGFIETPASKSGVLGLNFLRQFNVLIDYKSHKLSYYSYQRYPENLNLSACHAIKTDFTHGIIANFYFNNNSLKMN